MIDRSLILLLSISLFSIGIVGVITHKSLIKIIVSVEVILFGAILNFCYFAGSKIIKSGHFAALTAVVLSGMTIALLYTLITTQNRTADV